MSTWTRGQWPDAITTGEIEYSRGSEIPHMGEWYALRDSSHGIPIFGSVRSADRASLHGQEVRVFNYPNQTELIAAELVKRWNAYPKLLAEIGRLHAEAPLATPTPAAEGG